MSTECPDCWREIDMSLARAVKEYGHELNHCPSCGRAFESTNLLEKLQYR